MWRQRDSLKVHVWWGYRIISYRVVQWWHHRNISYLKVLQLFNVTQFQYKPDEFSARWSTYWALKLRAYLDATFSVRSIGQDGPTSWSWSSPDPNITSRDFCWATSKVFRFWDIDELDMCYNYVDPSSNCKTHCQNESINYIFSVPQSYPRRGLLIISQNVVNSTKFQIILISLLQKHLMLYISVIKTKNFLDTLYILWSFTYAFKASKSTLDLYHLPSTCWRLWFSERKCSKEKRRSEIESTSHTPRDYDTFLPICLSFNSSNKIICITLSSNVLHRALEHVQWHLEQYLNDMAWRVSRAVTVNEYYSRFLRSHIIEDRKGWMCRSCIFRYLFLKNQA